MSRHGSSVNSEVEPTMITTTELSDANCPAESQVSVTPSGLLMFCGHHYGVNW